MKKIENNYKPHRWDLCFLCAQLSLLRTSGIITHSFVFTFDAFMVICPVLIIFCLIRPFYLETGRSHRLLLKPSKQMILGPQLNDFCRTRLRPCSADRHWTSSRSQPANKQHKTSLFFTVQPGFLTFFPAARLPACALAMRHSIIDEGSLF